MLKKFLLLVMMLSLGGCLQSPPPAPPSPPPPPPTTAPPLPDAPCVPLSQFGNPPGDELHISNLAFIVVDATPKVKNLPFCQSIGFSGSVCPLGPEGTQQRANCEAKSGPYVWTFQAVLENGTIAPLHECGQDASDPVCFLNNGNPLQVKIRKPTLGGSVCIMSEPFEVVSCAVVFPAF